MIGYSMNGIVRFASIAAFCVGLLFSGRGALAQTVEQAQAKALPGSWTVTRIEGEVRVRAPTAVTPISLTPSAALPPEAEVETGADGAVVLTDGRDIIALRPNSMIVLPKQAGRGFTAKVLQMFGTALYTIETRRASGFKVETPQLVAAVKGTVFKVSAHKIGGSVSVTEGLVGVEQKQTGRSVDVAPGMTASAPSAKGAAMVVVPTPASEDDFKAAPLAGGKSAALAAPASGGTVAAGSRGHSDAPMTVASAGIASMPGRGTGIHGQSFDKPQGPAPARSSAGDRDRAGAAVNASGGGTGGGWSGGGGSSGGGYDSSARGGNFFERVQATLADSGSLVAVVVAVAAALAATMVGSSAPLAALAAVMAAVLAVLAAWLGAPTATVSAAAVVAVTATLTAMASGSAGNGTKGASSSNGASRALRTF